MLTGADWTRAQTRHHDAVAGGEYDESVLREYAYFNHIIHRYLRELRREGCRRLLDFGCGTGRVTLLGARVGLPVVAMDLSLEMVRQSREKLGPSLWSRVQFVVADGTRLPFRDGVFEAVVCAGVLHHIENVTVAIGEQLRVLSPGGRILIGEPSADPSRLGRLLNRIADRAFGLANSVRIALGRDAKFIPARRSPGERPLSAAAIISVLQGGGVTCACRWYLHHSLVNRFVPLSTLFFLALNAVWRRKGGDILVLTGKRN